MKKKKWEFSKKLTAILTIYNIVMTIWAFILLTIGREVPAEIVVAFVVGLFGEFSSYLAKALMAKKAEEETRLKEKEMNDDGLN